MSKRSYNSDLEKEDHVIKRQRKKEKFDKLQREMETLQRKIDLFSSDSSSDKQQTKAQSFREQRKTRGKARSFTEFDKIEVCRDSVPSKSEQEALPKTSPTEGQEISAIEVSENHEKGYAGNLKNVITNWIKITKNSTILSWFSSPRAPSPYPGCGTFIRMAFLKKNIPEEAIPILLASVSEKTMKQYNTVFTRWWEFCIKNTIEPFEYNLSGIISFIKSILDKDFSFSSINTHRSALSLVIDIPEKDKSIVSRYFKGIYNLKTPTPKYSFTWDPSLVLVYLEKLYPIEQLSLEKLSHKLVMLMALTSAHRLQTISLIKIQNILVTEDQVEIRIPDRIKTSGKNRCQPTLRFPFFIEKPELCVASTICHYLKITKVLRSPLEDRLVLTIKKPHRAASSQSLSRWLKNILTTCGIDTNIFKGYSTRHAATSAAARAGLNIEIIRETAGWTNKSDVFNKFYHKPLARDDSTFAKAVLTYQNNK
nr:unnamed protein product [Callosobruchus analis]